jgi:coenzyme F420-dependent glucose-6-phosphate dehydrogenase
VAHEQWRFAAIDDPDELWNLRTPRDFASATRDITMDQVLEKIPTSSDLEFHAERLKVYAELGVERVFVLNVGSNQREFIERFGAEVLPALDSTRTEKVHSY